MKTSAKLFYGQNQLIVEGPEVPNAFELEPKELFELCLSHMVKQAGVTETRTPLTHAAMRKDGQIWRGLMMLTVRADGWVVQFQHDQLLKAISMSFEPGSKINTAAISTGRLVFSTEELGENGPVN